MEDVSYRGPGVQDQVVAGRVVVRPVDGALNDGTIDKTDGTTVTRYRLPHAVSKAKVLFSRTIIS